jgi:pyruvate dehydrogenase E1 component beta subunit
MLTFAAALNEAADLVLAADRRVFIMGLGVPDPKGLFGSTAGLVERHGPARVRDMPTAENGMTGIALGAALAGMRPILTHQRVDFALLAMEQMVNQVAKWHYMFGGQASAALVIRMIIGRGWGQGPQHAQSLQSWFAHVPGLKVVMPSTPYDAKGLLIASVEDDAPVVIFEHRWLYNIEGAVPEGVYRVPLGSARVAREGTDVTIAATSFMTLEALRAAEVLASRGVSVEVVDVRSLAPLDEELLVRSVSKTRHLVVADTGGVAYGAGAEIAARMTERCFGQLGRAPRRVGLAECPSPSSPALAADYYPRAAHVVSAIYELLDLGPAPKEPDLPYPLDVPDPSFTGPF